MTTRCCSYATPDDAMAAVFVLESFGIDAAMCATSVYNAFGSDHTEWQVVARVDATTEPQRVDAAPGPTVDPDEHDAGRSSWWDEQVERDYG